MTNHDTITLARGLAIPDEKFKAVICSASGEANDFVDAMRYSATELRIMRPEWWRLAWRWLKWKRPDQALCIVYEHFAGKAVKLFPRFVKIW